MLVIWDCKDGSAAHTRLFEFPLNLRKECNALMFNIVCWGPVYTKEHDKHPSYIFCMANTKDVFVNSFEFDISSMQYGMKQGKCQLPSTGLLRQYTGCKIIDEFLYAGTMGGEICLFHIFTRLYKGSIPISSHGLLCFEIIERTLYTGGGDGKVKKVNMLEGSWTMEKEVQLDGKVISISSSIDKKELICGTTSGKIYRLLASDLNFMVHTDAHISCIYDIAFPLSSNDFFATIDDSVYFLNRDYKGLCQNVGCWRV